MNGVGEQTTPTNGRGRRPAHAGPAGAHSRPGRILVVEDEPDVGELIRYNLAKEGYDVVKASNGVEALRQARDKNSSISCQPTAPCSMLSGV